MRSKKLEAAPSRHYGDGADQQRQIDAVPIPAAAPSVAPAGPAPFITPPAFDRDSERPDEPATAGLASGPGPGPEALGIIDNTLSLLTAMYAAFPSRELRDLILDEQDRAS